ncbi:hypothetical protein B5M42_012380 [Paenibacillus athensensis]|uniref:hypothetical protein n=1 Tax=Paenibacillus athensensis TaxID=1967502 RepID=UPI00106FE97D|nr:hypothetical protein [Paenibacillus athensensis]MCD1259629.1 hypothetical protein [Paenibacillus athensensis]
MNNLTWSSEIAPAVRTIKKLLKQKNVNPYISGEKVENLELSSSILDTITNERVNERPKPLRLW